MYKDLDPARITAIAALLDEQPHGIGPAITDRNAWRALAARPQFAGVLARAEALLREPLPPIPDDFYLDYTRTGDRSRWEGIMLPRRARLVWLVLAECIENKRRFLPVIEELVDSLCAERTWVFPAHDWDLANFNGTRVDIDLFSAMLAWNLAAADHVLGSGLPNAVREALRANVHRRVLAPFLEMIAGRATAIPWWNHTNNWNAVCLAGVTGAALALVPERADRAVFAAAAEHYIGNFLRGFTPDGYCSEGMVYWNFGFGQFTVMAEALRLATHSAINLFDNEHVAAIAAYAPQFEIAPGVCAAFADCPVSTAPEPVLLNRVNRIFGLGLAERPVGDMKTWRANLYEVLMDSFVPPAAVAQTSRRTVSIGVRWWFPDASVLVCRPQPGSACRLGAAMKGGHNNEHHNHNDIGSYVVTIDNQPLLLDPGCEVYTAKTFSAHRYESVANNSFGHAVPVVDGQLQKTGKQACSRVATKDFSEERDTLRLDMTAAYDAPALRKLERMFVYSRAAAGSFQVCDEVQFSTPARFETALVAVGAWEQIDATHLRIACEDRALEISIDTGGAPFTLYAEELNADYRPGMPTRPIRIGIRLAEPATAARVTLTLRPMR